MPDNRIEPEGGPYAADVEGGGGGADNASIQDSSMDAQCVRYAGDDPGFFEKGNISNICTFVIMVVGVVLRIFKDSDWPDFWAGRIILAFGLFGFAGGVTNWLAVKMLFDEIPGVYGSGIIPKQFEQIKSTIKKMIMDTFFEPQFLEKQLKEKLSGLADDKFVKEKLQAILDSPEFEKVLDEKLEAASGSATGMFLNMMGITGGKLKPFIRPFVSAMAGDIARMVSKSIEGPGGAAVPIKKLRDEVDKLMDERLKELTAARIKTLIEVIMRQHLGWLVVWGNIFGGVIGVVSEAAGY